MRLPTYIRLGKFNSKARLEWEKLIIKSAQPIEREEQALDFLLNAADLPPATVSRLRAFSIYNVHPAPLLSRCHLGGDFWQCRNKAGKDVYLPAGMRFGVDAIV